MAVLIDELIYKISSNKIKITEQIMLQGNIHIVLFAGYYKKSEILVISSFVSAEEKVDLVLELKFLLAELAKG